MRDIPLEPSETLFRRRVPLGVVSVLHVKTWHVRQYIMY